MASSGTSSSLCSVEPMERLANDPAGESRAPALVDVARVPVYPVMRLEVRGGQAEAEVEGIVDGVATATGDGSSVRSAVVAVAAEAAARRPCGAIRVRLTGFESGEAGVVTSSGELVPAALTAPVRSRRRLLLLLLAAALVVVLAAGGLLVVSRSESGWWTARGTRAVRVAPGPSPTQLPVVAPQGWPPVARWSLPLTAASSTSVSVAAWGSLVFAPGGDGASVVAVDARSGRRVWSASVAKSVVGGSLAGGPVVLAMGGHPLVAAWTSDRFFVWDPATGAVVGAWPLPADTSAVSAAGPSAVVLGQGQHVQVFDGRSLVSRVLPAGAAPMGGTADGALVAAGAGRAWLVRSDRVAGPGTRLAAPEGVGWVQPVGLAGGVLVVAYSAASSPESVVLRGFATSTWAPVWTSAPVPATRYATGGAGSWPLWTAPDGSWGIYGSTLLDLATGAARALPGDWSTSAIGASRAFGTTGGGVGSVSRSGAVTAAAAGPSSSGSSSGSAPVAPAAVNGDGWALVVATDGSRSSVYAVPPTTQDTGGTGASSTSSPASPASAAPTGSGAP